MKKRQNKATLRIRFFRMRKGFTMFEMVVVMGIVAVFTGVVQIEFDEMHRKTHVSNSATQALADLRYAQEMAMTYRHPVNFIVNVSNNTYTAQWSGTGVTLPSSTQTGDLIVDFDDVQDVSMSMGISSTLSFDEQGHPFYGGASFDDELPVFRINEDIYLCVLPSGFSYLNYELYEGGGCGGFGC
jgi:prepilin-type N-terminal cleavage/methylation domain-containing protein